ncbi:hypothetical protein NQ317_004639 [Molorchus minor]|uniref:Cadherin domain-containing protein n=1 Tax=Molorchus minor TaxID=1323400 RepID=A0ABQ9ITM6_9CUCU|nr:hypothetical protein NQ317_004639 [Molorchus minor]
MLVCGTMERCLNGNRSRPDFIGAPYEFWVGGNVDIGTSVGQIRVSDMKDKDNVLYDLLHTYHEGVPFAVEERSGTITVIEDLKKFKKQNYNFEAVVTDEKDITLITNVTIHIVDPTDEKSILMRTGSSNTPIEFHVKENQPNVLIGKLGFKSNDTENLKFTIANQKDVTDHISITSDGTLFTQRPLDRETRGTYRLTIIAEYIKGALLGTGIYQVTVIVDDENDNNPEFERDSYEGRIPENSKSGTEVDLNFPVHVSDSDIGENGEVTITIFGNGSENFRLDRNFGKIQFISAESPLDRETTSVYNLRLVAKDKGGRYSEAKLTIQVEDENDNPPMFTRFTIYLDKGVEVFDYDTLGNRIGQFEPLRNVTPGLYILSKNYTKSRRQTAKMSPLVSLPEDLAVGSPVFKVTAEDKDEGGNAVVKYEILSETYIPNESSTEPFHLIQYFMVHSTTGEVLVARTLPPESEFRLNISATDKGGLKDYLAVKIFIRDVNDHPPVFKKSWYNFDAEEASYSRNILGRIEATDADFGTNANITYSIKINNTVIPFSISQATGLLSVNGKLDRETQDKYSFIVVAKDNPKMGRSLSSSVNVEVNVLDVNDNAPIFYGYDELIPNPEANTFSNHNYQEYFPVYFATAAENSPIGTPVTRIFANDTDFTGNGNGLILFDIPYKKSRQNLFAIDSKEGIVTTIGKLDYETESSHNITIIASDLGSPSLSSTAILTVNIIDVPEDISSIERPVFSHRYYEVEVEENVPVPLKILTLNVTEPYRSHKLRYSIAADKNSDSKRAFRIDPRNGSLYIVESPDREQKALYELIIRLDQYKVGRDMTVMVYPVTNERLGNLELLVKITKIEAWKQLSNYLPAKSREHYEKGFAEFNEWRQKQQVMTINEEVMLSYFLNLKKKYAISSLSSKYSMLKAVIGLTEVKVIIRVTDVNDNEPKFTVTGRPIVAAIPTTANYGYQVVRMQRSRLPRESGKLQLHSLECVLNSVNYPKGISLIYSLDGTEIKLWKGFEKATDPDLGLNGEVRYQILSRADEASRRFAIDAVTGQVRESPALQRMLVKFLDLMLKLQIEGALMMEEVLLLTFSLDIPLSVYVLDEQKQLVMVMGLKPTEVEKSMDNITSILYNATGFDVRVRKLEPHSERNQVDNTAPVEGNIRVYDASNKVATEKESYRLHGEKENFEIRKAKLFVFVNFGFIGTDMYLYAVDQYPNTVVDIDKLHRILKRKHNEIERASKEQGSLRTLPVMQIKTTPEAKGFFFLL